VGVARFVLVLVLVVQVVAGGLVRPWSERKALTKKAVVVGFYMRKE
jgi:hypothetical protein